jgi:hypothetical protein
MGNVLRIALAMGGAGELAESQQRALELARGGQIEAESSYDVSSFCVTELA